MQRRADKLFIFKLQRCTKRLTRSSRGAFVDGPCHSESECVYGVRRSRTWVPLSVFDVCHFSVSIFRQYVVCNRNLQGVSLHRATFFSLFCFHPSFHPLCLLTFFILFAVHAPLLRRSLHPSLTQDVYFMQRRISPSFRLRYRTVDCVLSSAPSFCLAGHVLCASLIITYLRRECGNGDLGLPEKGPNCRPISPHWERRSLRHP